MISYVNRACYDIKMVAKENLLAFAGSLPSRGPDFFIAGASRSGTTYLHYMLKSQADIFMPETKELQYFNRDRRYRENLRGYRSCFKGYKNEPIIGEVTPFYFYAHMLYNEDNEVEFDREESAISRIHRNFPDAKIIVTLRDPFIRLVSMYEKNFYQGKIKTSLQQAIQDELDGKPFPTLLHRGRYDIHLANILQHYPPSSVKILIFEKWTRDYSGTLQDICAFLGADISAEGLRIPEEGKNQSDNYKQDTIKKPDVDLDDETHHAVIDTLKPSYDYVEKLLGKSLPWQDLVALKKAAM